MKYLMVAFMLLVSVNVFSATTYTKESNTSFSSVETKTDVVTNIYNVERLRNSRAALLEEVAQIDALLVEAANLGIE